MGGLLWFGRKRTYISVLTSRISNILEVRPPKPPYPRILGSVDGGTLRCPKERSENIEMAV